MKRVKSACIMQTLIFAQKPELGFSRERALAVNKDEVLAYRASLEKAHTRYQIDEEAEQADGSVIVRVRKHYNSSTDVGEYFDK